MDEPVYWDRRAAAKALSISTRSVDRMRERGLPVYRITPRGKVLIRPRDVEQFLIRQRVLQPNLDELVEDVMKDFNKGG